MGLLDILNSLLGAQALATQRDHPNRTMQRPAREKYLYAAFASVTIEESRFSIPETIAAEDEENRIVFDSMYVVIPRRTRVTVQSVYGNTHPAFINCMSFPPIGAVEETFALDLDNQYPPAGSERYFDPHGLFTGRKRFTVPPPYSQYFGRGIFRDDSYGALGLFATMTVDEKRKNRVTTSSGRRAHFHYEYAIPSTGPAALIFVDVGRDNLPLADLVVASSPSPAFAGSGERHQEHPLVRLLYSCSPQLEEIGCKYLLPKCSIGSLSGALRQASSASPSPSSHPPSLSASPSLSL